MAQSSFQPEYEGGIPIFRPAYEDFRDFRSFVNQIEPFGMKSGIVKVIPPKEWLESLPKLPSAKVDDIEIRSPIIQNISLGSSRGVFEVENVEKRRKFTVKQWIAQCNKLGNQPPMRRGEKQRVLGEYEAKDADYVTYNDDDFSSDILEYLETRFWKGLAYGGSPMYGADLPGSLFNEHTNEWNVSRLDSLLASLPDSIPGVTDAYLYCGMWKATFAWHLEDMDLPSINYIHFGAPKQWYTIPQSHHEQFYDLMAALWPKEQEKCSEFLRHKTFLADPAFIRQQGIPVNQIIHRQHEFMITFPYGYHAGFNYGFNIAESVNFAHDSWLRIGAKAKKCVCVSHSVGIDVQQMLDLIQASGQSQHLPGYGAKENSTLKRPQRRGKCILCPNSYTGEYLSNRDRTALVHVNCANLTPETFIAGKTVYGLQDIPKARFSLRCHYCKQSLGSCFQCAAKLCTRAYHASCAAAAGVEYHDRNRPLCKYHRPKPDNSDQYVASTDADLVIPGDVVQFIQNKSYGAGKVKHNDTKKKMIEVSTLPEVSETRWIGHSEVVALYTETPQGPFIEPVSAFLKPLGVKKQRRSAARDGESDGAAKGAANGAANEGEGQYVNHEYANYYKVRNQQDTAEQGPSLLSPPEQENHGVMNC